MDETLFSTEPPPTRAEANANINEDYWEEWAASIEFKVSRQGQFLLGVGGVLLITLAITGLQGKVVAKLVKGFGEVVDVLNQSGLTAVNTTSDSEPKGRYNQASGSVQTQAAPVDDDLLNELHENIAKTKDVAPRPEDVL